jgi:hypothetical protein
VSGRPAAAAASAALATFAVAGTAAAATEKPDQHVRFHLVRRGIRVLSRGAYLRNGGWYELDHRPYELTLEMTDEPRRPDRRMSLLIAVHFRESRARHAVFVWRSRATHGGGSRRVLARSG